MDDMDGTLAKETHLRSGIWGRELPIVLNDLWTGFGNGSGVWPRPLEGEYEFSRQEGREQ